MLDSGSQSTFIRSDLAQQLALRGVSRKLNVTAFDGVEKNVRASVVNFDVFSSDGTAHFKVKNAYAIDELRVKSNPTLTSLPLNKWSYLSDIPFCDVDPEDVKLLIGIDIVAAHQVADSRTPPDEVVGPWALKTAFGWCLAGPTGLPAEGEGAVC